MIEYSKEEKVNAKEINQKENQNKFNQCVGDFSRFDKYKEIDLQNWTCEITGTNESDFNLYSLPFQDSGLVIHRSEFSITGVSVQAIINKWTKPDFELYLKSGLIKEARYVGESKEESKIIYMIVCNPKMAEREYVTELSYKREENGSIKIIVHSIDIPEIPISNDIIRAEMSRTIWVQQVEENKLHITSIALDDYKGYIPKLFMNMMQVKLANQHMGAHIIELQMEEQKLQKEKQENQ